MGRYVCNSLYYIRARVCWCLQWGIVHVLLVMRMSNGSITGYFTTANVCMALQPSTGLHALHPIIAQCGTDVCADVTQCVGRSIPHCAGLTDRRDETHHQLLPEGGPTGSNPVAGNKVLTTALPARASCITSCLFVLGCVHLLQL